MRCIAIQNKGVFPKLAAYALKFTYFLNTPTAMVDRLRVWFLRYMPRRVRYTAQNQLLFKREAL
jgi:hypothetical protein